MSNVLRSKQGCWTCRLRKKKCDEIRPECTTCVGLSIICYGFGPKPDWMDGGDAERRVSNGLKQIVKYSSRRKSNTHVTFVRKPAVHLAPKSTIASSTTPTSGSDTSRMLENTPPSDHSIPIYDLCDATVPASLQHLAQANTTAEEYTLLMHFLDEVFPLQYPLYQPHIFEGGRGWLLALLLRTKPLYYAALALSSYHRRMSINQIISERCRAKSFVQQASQLEACLIEVQRAMKTVDHFIQHGPSGDGMGMVSSIVQLVFFELFAGEDGIWKTHLNAAIDMYHRNCQDGLAHLGLSPLSRAKLRDDKPVKKDEGVVVSQEVSTFRFMGGTIIWLDVISSITAGTAPRLLSYHPGVLASNSNTALEKLMGCRNWAMRQIGRIAALHGQRRQARQAGRFDEAEFYQNVVDIRNEIEFGLAGEALDHFGISSGGTLELTNALPQPITLVTRMFAWMATVYLHLITSGFQDLEHLNTPINGALNLLQTQIPAELIPALVAPLFIIGCVAREGAEQEFFRTIHASPRYRESLFKHRAQVSMTIEEVWSRRRTESGLAWDDVLGLSQVRNLLLL